MRARSPSVFSATVFPPVFGPVITSSRASPSNSMVIGTIVPDFDFKFRSRSGWRALRRITMFVGETGVPARPWRAPPACASATCTGTQS